MQVVVVVVVVAAVDPVLHPQEASTRSPSLGSSRGCVVCVQSYHPATLAAAFLPLQHRLPPLLMLISLPWLSGTAMQTARQLLGANQYLNNAGYLTPTLSAALSLSLSMCVFKLLNKQCFLHTPSFTVLHRKYCVSFSFNTSFSFMLSVWTSYLVIFPVNYFSFVFQVIIGFNIIRRTTLAFLSSFLFILSFFRSFILVLFLDCISSFVPYFYFFLYILKSFIFSRSKEEGEKTLQSSA